MTKLGKEPFSIDDVQYLLEASKNKKTPIKSNLLSQELITGLGNIYVDEVLYASKIHPLTNSNVVDKRDWENIVKNSVVILNEAIRMGGSTIKSYHPGKDIDGNFQTRLKIYGRSGESCPTCGATYRFIKVGGRGTTFCPVCQIKLGAPLNIALTGKIASGKSTLLNLMKQNHIATLSSDEVVNDLYKKEEVTQQIERLLGIKFPDKFVDKDILRKHVLLNPKDRKKLEKVVHFMVLKKIKDFLATSTSDIRVVEIPLLFEAKMDVLFDSVIITDIDINIQKERILNRDKDKAMYLLEINKNNKIDENKNKATYLIHNNGSKDEFIDECSKLINKLKGRLN